jgi:DeoR/GlpR family transcriptional regulator of sugar metabolism
MHLKTPTINLCGGSLNRANLALSGSFTLDMLEKINIDTAFLGVSGYDDTSGFTTGQESEAKVKSLVLKKSRTTVAMMDSTKISKILPFTFGKLADFTYVIVDGEMSPDFTLKAASCGVKII